MYRYLVRWRFEGSDHAEEVSFTTVQQAEAKIARLIECNCSLQWITGPSRYQV